MTWSGTVCDANWQDMFLGDKKSLVGSWSSREDPQEVGMVS